MKGKEISRAEAIKIALDTIRMAEVERILFAEKEALVGIPPEFYATIDKHFWEMV